jgi:hypothetical protein
LSMNSKDRLKKEKMLRKNVLKLRGLCREKPLLANVNLRLLRKLDVLNLSDRKSQNAKP